MLTELRSFDGTESIQAEFVRPDRYSHLFGALTEGSRIIPRGAGLNYCAASAGVGIRSVSSLLFNRILDFDSKGGRIVVEPGIRLGDLYRFTVQRGWILGVMPGHPSITVGGCIACNVHGKNHRREGNFINVVESLTLFHPDHGEIICSPEHEQEVFRLTVGGFGLTGYITSARLRLERLWGSGMLVRRIAVPDLTETVRTMEAEGEGAELLHSWNNFNLRSEAFGAGFVYVGRSLENGVSDSAEFKQLSPEGLRRLPVSAYAGLVTRAMLRAYSWSERLHCREKVVSLATAIFPPHGKEFYFGLFGRKGFREYQLLVPRLRWKDAEEALPGLIRRHNVPITLGSLKLFHGRAQLLNFDGMGVCVTVDAPEGEQTRGLFNDLDELTLAVGGIVNLAKDSRVSAAFAQRVFPGYEDFKARLAAYSPRRRFDSALRMRLDV